MDFPSKIIFRPPTEADIPAIAELIIAADIAEVGETDFSMAELQVAMQQRPDFDLARDAWVAVAPGAGPEGQDWIVGYEDLWNRDQHTRLNGDGYVHPQWLGLGIGTALLRLADARGQAHIPLAPPERRVYARNGIYGSDQAAHCLHREAGYTPIRFFWRMQINMETPPPAPVWPPGLKLRTFNPGQDERPVFEAMDEAFADHWGHIPADYNFWTQRMFGKENFDPSLNFLVLDGDQIAAAALCFSKQEKGWVEILGVRRPWRRQGLGVALLNQAFGEFYRRSARVVELGVDAQNPTGATHLYQQAGMHVAYEYVVYEKELRPGI